MARVSANVKRFAPADLWRLPGVVCANGGTRVQRVRPAARPPVSLRSCPELRAVRRAIVRAMVLLTLEELDPLADGFADRLVEIVQLDGHLPGADMVVPVRLPKIWQKERCFS